MKTIYIFLFILFTQVSIVKSNDSLRYEKLSGEVENLKTENLLLKQKVEVLNTSNTKFLTVTYSTIGFCFMVILGIGIWNAIQSHRINNKKLENIRDSIKIELSKENSLSLKNIFDKEKIQIDNEKAQNKTEFDELKKAQLEDSIKIQMMSCASIDVKEFKNINIEEYSLCTLISLSHKYYLVSKNESYLKKSYNFLNNYIDKYGESNNILESDREDLTKMVKKTQTEGLKEIGENIIKKLNKK